MCSGLPPSASGTSCAAHSDHACQCTHRSQLTLTCSEIRGVAALPVLDFNRRGSPPHLEPPHNIGSLSSRSHSFQWTGIRIALAQEKHACTHIAVHSLGTIMHHHLQRSTELENAHPTHSHTGGHSSYCTNSSTENNPGSKKCTETCVSVYTCTPSCAETDTDIQLPTPPAPLI